jgi:hypothetical protein
LPFSPAGSSPSARFGFSASGAGSIIALGMVGGLMFSSTADLGSYFYVSRDFLDWKSNLLTDSTTYYDGEDGILYSTYASSSLVCVVPRQVLSFPVS